MYKYIKDLTMTLHRTLYMTLQNTISKLYSYLCISNYGDTFILPLYISNKKMRLSLRKRPIFEKLIVIDYNKNIPEDLLKSFEDFEIGFDNVTIKAANCITGKRYDREFN